MGVAVPPAAPPPAAVNVFANLVNSPWLPADWVLTDPIGTANGSPFAVTFGGPGDVKHLADYDLILVYDLPPLGTAPHFEDALRQICDAGAVLWLDFSAPTPVPPVPALAEFVIAAGAGGGALLDALPSGLMQRPYVLAADELVALGAGGEVNIGNARAELHPVIGAAAAWDTPGVAAGRYGSGGIVVSATDLVGRLAGGTPVEQAALAKFVCNMLEWSQRWDQDRATPRHFASINLTVEPPLVPAWQFPDPLRPMAGQPNGLSIGPILAQPVVADGVAYVVTSPPLGGTGRIYALDVHPPCDLDRDGLADDGVPDYSLGAQYDVVWQHDIVGGGGTIGTPLFASPCVATRRAPGGEPQRVVLVTSLAGNRAHLVMYDARTGAELLYRNDSMGGVQYAGSQTVWVSSPVVHDGYVYVLTEEVRNNIYYTRVYAVDLDTLGTVAGGAVWAYPVPALEPNPDLIPPVIDPAAIAARPGPTPSVSASAFLSLLPPGAAGPAPRLLDAVVRFGTDASFTSDTNPGDAVYASPPLPGGAEYAIVPTPDPGAPGPPGGVGVNYGYYTAYLTTGGAPPPTPTGATQDDGATAVAPAPAFGPGYATFTEAWARGYFVNEGQLPAQQLSADPIGWQEGRFVQLTHAGGTETVFLHGPVLWKRRLNTLPEPRIGSHTVDAGTVFAPTLGPAGQSIVRALKALDGDEVFSFARLFLGGPASQTASTAGDSDTLYFMQSTPTASGLTAIRLEPTDAIKLGCGPPPVPPNAGVVPGWYDANGDGNLDRFEQLIVKTVPGWPVALNQIVDPGTYRVNAKTRELVISPDAVDPATGQTLAGFPIWVDYTHDAGDPTNPGTWGTIADELHFVPDPRRYAVEPGTIKLRYPLALNAGTATPIAPPEVYLAGYGKAPEAQIIVPPAAVSLDGRINLSGLTTPAPASIPAEGHSVEVHYVGYSEYDQPTGTPPTPIVVGTPAANPGLPTLLPPERHFVPPPTAQALASPAVTGDTVHYGTDVNSVPAVSNRTLVSVRWPGQGSTTRTVLSEPAVPHAGYTDPGAGALPPPAVSASASASATSRDPIDVPAAPAPNPYSVPAYLLTQRSLPVIAPQTAPGDVTIVPPLDDGVVLAGSFSPAGPTPGFISALSPARTIIAEGARIVDVLGDEVERVLTGTISLVPAEPEQPGFTTTVRSARSLRPLAQPAKVRVLDPDRNICVSDPRLVQSAGGAFANDMRVGTRVCATHYLVVDTANDRVVEIDQNGNVVWPLERGLDVRATPPAPVWFEKDLGLNSPTDAYRWVSLDPQDLDGNGSTADIVYHTTVADTGNFRIVDFQTIVHPDVWYPGPPAAPPLTCEQVHISALDIKSPSYLLVDLNPLDADTTPTKLARVAYTHAYPLFDPENGAHVGFLAAAANLNRFVVIDTSNPAVPPVAFPAPGTVPMGGALAWGWIAWLYDRNLDGVPDDPLLFDTIRDLTLFPEPTGLVTTPTGTWPTNGRGVWPTATDYQPGSGRDLWLTVTCGRYLTPPDAGQPAPVGNFARRIGLTALPAGSIEGQSIVEFNVDFPAGGGFGFPVGGVPAEPSWFFTDVDYHYADPYNGPVARAMTTLTDPSGATVPKPWLPSSARRLPDGTHLIVNAAPQRSAITAANFLGQDANLSEVIQVETNYVRWGAMPPPAGPPFVHSFDVFDVIPNPMLPPWPEGLNQPTCAVRY
ncbi:MAG: hypothetical protein ACE5O2_03160 [Armatimonadota bacterium]